MSRTERLRALLCFGLLLGATACARPQAGVTVLPTADQAAAADDWHHAEDLLSARMRSIADGLSTTGQAPADFAQRGFLASGARATHMLVAPPGRCLTVVALATAGIADLDASIFEVDGRAVAQDAASDARPVLRACAGEQERRLYYVLHAFSGSGAYLVASFDGPLEEGQSRQLSDGEAGPATHSDWTAALVRRGFEPEGPPVELDLSPEAQVRVALPARVGQCVALVAFAAEPGADVDLWLADEAGIDRVRDDASRPWAGVQLCPESSGVFAARVSVRGAASRVQVVRFTGRASHVGGERAMWLGEPVPPDAGGAEHSAAKAAAGSTQAAAGSLVAGAIEERTLPMPQARCAGLAVELGEGLGAASVQVAELHGAVLRRATLTGPSSVLHVCGAGGHRVRVRIEAQRGVGSYQLRARATDRAEVAALAAVPPPAAAQLLDLQAEARARGWPTPALQRVAADALTCDARSGACSWSHTAAGLADRCLSAASVDAHGRPAVLTVHAEGVAEARALRGFTTRCVHGGAVELRAEPDAPGAVDLYVLSVQHAARHGRPLARD